MADNNVKVSGKTMKKILKFMAIFIVLYTIIVLVMGFAVQYEPSTLTTSVFAFCGAEGGFTTIIKVVKEINKNKSSKKGDE